VFAPDAEAREPTKQERLIGCSTYGIAFFGLATAFLVGATIALR
jgi:hypothetical protein